MTSRHLRRIESIVPRRAEGFGGKARGLAALARAGFPVPAAYAIAGAAADDHAAAVLSAADRIGALLAASPKEVDDARLASIRARLQGRPLEASLATALRDVFRALRRSGVSTVAVRSSSTREDDEAASGAGLHLTVLDVASEDALLDAVRACWASLYTPAVLAYLRARAQRAAAVGARPTAAESVQVGVVVQAMVPADVAGVLFTVNPLTGDGGEIVINASWGLGSLVVDGRVSPDTWRIDKDSGLARDQVVGEKRLRAVVTGTGVREEPVPDEQVAQASLTPHQVEELVALARRVEAHFGDARDVEWAFAGGTLYVLQARPVTTVAVRVGPRRARRSRERAAERARIVWSNVNVGEALPGVATPLTWSILSKFSDLGFRRAFGALGCTVPRDAELVGDFRGRIYLNLSEFMAILTQVPGLRPRTLLALGGGGEAERLEAEIEARGRSAFLVRLPFTVSRFMRENVAITARVAEFEAAFAVERARLGGVDLRILAPAALGSTLRDVERLLDDTGAIMLTCYGNLLAAAVLLGKVLQVTTGPRADVLQRELTAGLADVESAAPGIALWHIAEMARTDHAARAAIVDRAPATLRVTELPEGPTRRALERFLEAHGGRGAREAELSEPRWREDASLVFATLRAHLARPSGAPGLLELERKRRAAREAAEAELAENVPTIVLPVVRHLLGLVQRFMRLRERLRAHVTDVLGLFRLVALEAGRRLDVKEGCGDDAAFFLGIDELRAWLAGRVEGVAPLVRARRQQYRRDVALPDPPDTFVGFPPTSPEPLPDADVLRGLAACSGRVVGHVRLLRDAGDAASLRAGEVLVAPYADVGWSPLFLVAAAVVTDLGGPLSHAAIIAREYGTPSVMNVKIGTRMLRTGDVVEVDGDRGEVRVLARVEATDLP
jgi:phosphohistidine swiveling domain-containing protein